MNSDIEKELTTVRMAARLANRLNRSVYLYRDNENQLTVTTNISPDWPIIETINPAPGDFDDEY